MNIGDVITYFRTPDKIEPVQCSCLNSGICAFCLEGVPLIYLGEHFDEIFHETPTGTVMMSSNLHRVFHPTRGVMFFYRNGVITRMTVVALMSDAVG